MEYAEALAVLDLKPGATAAEIEAAYKAAVRAWHPDRFSSEDMKATAEARLKRINEARTVLTAVAQRIGPDADETDRGDDDFRCVVVANQWPSHAGRKRVLVAILFAGSALAIANWSHPLEQKLRPRPVAIPPMASTQSAVRLEVAPTIPQSVCSRGNLEIWVEPQHPLPGQSYRLFARLTFNPERPPIRVYRPALDLRVTVRSTDGTEKQPGFNRTSPIQVKGGVVETSISIPGAELGSCDMVTVESRTLRQWRDLEVRF